MLNILDKYRVNCLVRITSVDKDFIDFQNPMLAAINLQRGQIRNITYRHSIKAYSFLLHTKGKAIRASLHEVTYEVIREI